MREFKRNDRGSYEYLPIPGRPFSAAVLVDRGYDLVHLGFQRPLPLADGLDAALAAVRADGRPELAVAGFELRLPRQLTAAEFSAFNDEYASQLRARGLEVEGALPAGRTNVAQLVSPVAEPSVYAVSYTVPSTHARPAFLVSGIPESVEGDASARLGSIVDALAERLEEMQVTWDDVSVIQVYGSSSLEGKALESVLKRVGPLAVHGMRWFLALPPTDAFTLEIDVRSAGVERVGS